YQRGCYGCFGPMETPNMSALGDWLLQKGMSQKDWVRSLRAFNANSPAFKEESHKHGSRE
ncbi:MAG TPA: hypothetical protein PK522_09140, partial [Nitrosomonas sp.]|nr:hypothetical protein [Nitrosomonas sp.]